MQPLSPTIVYPPPTGNVLIDHAVQKQVGLTYSIKAGQIKKDWVLALMIIKTLYIAIMGQIAPTIVVELKKVSTWNLLSVSQNPFQLIQMLTEVYQTGGFGVPTNSQLEEMKQYQRFTKFGQRKDVQSFYEYMSSQLPPEVNCYSEPTQ